MLKEVQEKRLEQESGNIYRFLFDKRRMEEMRSVLETGQVGLLQIWSPHRDIAPLLILSPGNPDVGCAVPISNANGDLECHATHVTMMAIFTTLGAEVFYATWDDYPPDLKRSANLTRHIANTFEWNLFDPESPPKENLKIIASHEVYGIPNYPHHLVGVDLDFQHREPAL